MYIPYLWMVKLFQMQCHAPYNKASATNTVVLKFKSQYKRPILVGLWYYNDKTFISISDQTAIKQ